MREIVDLISLWQRSRGQRVALATLVRTRGSSYRRPGARMLICPDGTTAGSLSGGCLEDLVVQCAFDVLASDRPFLLSFDTRLRFGCNGTIEVFVEPAREDFLAQISEHLRDRRSCRAVTVFTGQEEKLGSSILTAEKEAPPGAFIQELQPPIQLLIFGDGPDSAPLCSFADILGWRVVNVDQTVDLGPLIDERTAAIIKSHNYGRDFAALQSLLPLNLRYIGLLGPRKRRDQLLNALLDHGVSLNSELFAPAGFDLGAETPEEIALSIVSEINAVLAGATGESLRDHAVPIHGSNPIPTPARMQVEEWTVSAR